MATLKSLQAPKIISVEGSVIKIVHPDVREYPRTYLSSPIAAGGTAMSVADNDDFNDNDWFIVGEVGDEKTEECDVNGAVTRGTSLTVTNSLKFAHELDSPVTKIYERTITIYGADTDGGSLTPIRAVGAAIGITWGKPQTEFVLETSDAPYAFYVVKFYDGTTESSASDYVAAAGTGVSSVQNMILEALDMSGAEINQRITSPFLIRAANSCQNRITQYINKRTNVSKDWSFEMVEDTTSLDAATMENTYALSSLTEEMKYGETNQSILNVRVGSEIIYPYQIEDHDKQMQGVDQTTVATAVTAADTTLVVADSSEFSDAGSLTVGSDTVTYTAKDDSTNTFSGIPASGTGSFASGHSVGATVWQGLSGGLPSYYTIFNGNLIFDRPFSSTYDGYPIKVRYIKKLSTLSENSASTEVPFYWVFPFYIASRIEMRRGNFDKSREFDKYFEKHLQEQAEIDKSYILDNYRYFNFSDGNLLDEAWNGYPNTTAGLNNPLT